AVDPTRGTFRGAAKLARDPKAVVFLPVGATPRNRLRLFKTGGRLIRHARYFILQLADSHLTSTLFRQILGPIARLGRHPTRSGGRFRRGAGSALAGRPCGGCNGGRT